MDIPIALECSDFEGRKMVFLQDSFDAHVAYHPELEDRKYFPRQVINALSNPTCVVQGHHRDTGCYYLTLYSEDYVIIYTKVVVSTIAETINGKEVYRIKTAHKIDHIQEEKYHYTVKYL